MKNIVMGLTALAVGGFLVPLSAPAKAEEKVIIKEHRDHHPRMWERFHHRDRDAVVIKKKVREY